MDGLTEIHFEVDGETVTGGVPGETWHAIYRVPPELEGLTPITEAEAEQYGPPRFERVRSAPVVGDAALANERLLIKHDI